MSKAMNSPTARMLRSSRLFSMPPPLPQAAMEQVLPSGMIRTSDTATRPYPTRQAITAPASSRHRGDWGLKRPLPQKTNNTSSPHVRINGIDTLEHITDFDSAADHTLSYKKWQEMNIHMTKIPTETTGANLYPIAPPPSAFSNLSDHTVFQDDRHQGINNLPLGVERARRLRSMRGSAANDEHAARWRFDGPNLPSMPQAQFDRYVRRVVESPEMRKQFRDFLLGVRAEEKREQELDKMRQESGFDASRQEDVDRLEDACKIIDPEKEVDEFILELRDKNDDLSAKLSRLIGEFFDLPPFPKNRGAQSLGINRILAPLEDDASTSHPTHPSAGLSYLKTGAFMENHPLHGPQLDRTPTQARLLRPRDGATGQAESALIGVGGFAAKDITARNFRDKDLESNRAKTQAWNFENADSNKIYATPLYAFVDELGKIRMRINYPDKESVAVKTGGPDPRPRPIGNEDLSSAMQRFKQLDSSARSKDRERASDLATRGSTRRATEVKIREKARPLESQELRRFQEIIKRPNQDLGRTLVQTLRGRDSKK